MLEESQLQQSQKIKHAHTVFKPQNRPHVVSLDWLIDSMERGKIIDVEDDATAGSNYLIDCSQLNFGAAVRKH